MRSMLLRRILVILILVMLVGASLILVSNIIIGKDVHVDNEMSELMPKAEAMREMLTEYMGGNMTRDAFVNLSEALVKTTRATTVMLTGSGDVNFMYDYDIGMAPEDVKREFRYQIELMLQGNTIQANSVMTEKYDELLMVAVPVHSNSDNVIGGVMIIKSMSGVNTILSRMNMSLLWLTLISVVLLCVLAAWRVSLIAGPLRSMADMATDMANGDLDVRVSGDDAPGEIGLLARSLNELTDKLSRTIFQLRSEKSQLNLLLSSLSDGIAATDGLGVLTHYNPAIKRMFGAVEVRYREDLVADARIWDTFDKVYQTGNTETITYHLPGDRTLWITVSAVITEEGERTGVVGLFKDMTEIERLEEMRKEYVANVSHELRTPLTAVRGLLEPLCDGMVTDEATRERYYRTMLHEVLRLSRLITDMLTLSRLQSQNTEFELTKVDLREVVADVVDSFCGELDKRGISMPTHMDEDVVALTNADRIEQVLIILISNAIRYTPDGGTIAITVKRGSSLVISVEDNGCGIPAEDLPHVFERYYKVDKSRKEGGTGLGLSIAETIIDKLGERITVESELGRGTRFEFTVKRYVSDAIALGPASDDRHDAAPPDSAVRSKRAAGHSRRDPNWKHTHEVDAPYEIITDGK
ncbi:MAG: ATP-binding protein [Clostridia bacterium]|nr:ATP-binding protein [Clostridia bacterium]